MASALDTVGEAHDHFFEGAEKLLEIWFDSDDGQGDLRILERNQWEELLKLVNCEIISEKRDENMIAYVLSESSMFVSRNRFILKTCGTTTLLRAVEPLIELCKTQCGMHSVLCKHAQVGFYTTALKGDLFYSRKKFIRPQLQKHVHQDFTHEVRHLDEVFDNGAAYALGRINGDCWYMYTLEDGGVTEPDQTLELLMQGLDPEVMRLFTRDVSRDAAHATQESGIADILPGTIIDDFLFEPCGYSMNGILPNGQYFTIHVTPEPEFSYVSFESNVNQESHYDLIVKVLQIFKPNKFLMTLFANESSVAQKQHVILQEMQQLEGYGRTDHMFSQFKNYNLTYAYYERPPPGGARRPAGYI